MNRRGLAYDVFIAYHGTNEDNGSYKKALQIKKFLKEKNITVYMMKQGCGNLIEVQEETIPKCACFILVVNDSIRGNLTEAGTIPIDSTLREEIKIWENLCRQNGADNTPRRNKAEDIKVYGYGDIRGAEASMLLGPYFNGIVALTEHDSCEIDQLQLLFQWLVEDGKVTPSLIPNKEELTKIKQHESIRKLNTGNVHFGHYLQNNITYCEPIEWLVLKSDKSGSMLLTKNIIDCRQFHIICEDASWAESEICNWLNNGEKYKADKSFLELAFNKDEYELLDDYTIADKKFKAFLLSKEEVELYLNEKERKAEPTYYATLKRKSIAKRDLELNVHNSTCHWWLRSTEKPIQQHVYTINYDGEIDPNNNNTNIDVGVRVAIKIKSRI